MVSPQPSKPLSVASPARLLACLAAWAWCILPAKAELIRFSGQNHTGIILRPVTQYQPFEFAQLPGMITGRLDPLAGSPYAYTPIPPRSGSDSEGTTSDSLESGLETSRKDPWPKRENPFQEMLHRQLRPTENWDSHHDERNQGGQAGSPGRQDSKSRPDAPGTREGDRQDTPSYLETRSSTNRVTFSARDSAGGITNSFQVSTSPLSATDARIPIPGSLDRSWFNPYQQDRTGLDGALGDAQRRFLKARGMAVPTGTGALRNLGSVGRGSLGMDNPWLSGAASASQSTSTTPGGLPGLQLPNSQNRGTEPNLSAPRRTETESQRVRINVDRKPAELRIPQRPF